MNPAPALLDTRRPRVARAPKRRRPDLREHSVLSADEAFELLSIDRTTGYKAIREGTFPVPVLRIGRVIRIPTGALVRLLQMDDSAPPEDGGEE